MPIVRTKTSHVLKRVPTHFVMELQKALSSIVAGLTIEGYFVLHSLPKLFAFVSVRMAARNHESDAAAEPAPPSNNDGIVKLLEA